MGVKPLEEEEGRGGGGKEGGEDCSCHDCCESLVSKGENLSDLDAMMRLFWWAACVEGMEDLIGSAGKGGGGKGEEDENVAASFCAASVADARRPRSNLAEGDSAMLRGMGLPTIGAGVSVVGLGTVMGARDARAGLLFR